jgi:upstream activation factor subunit UAF30
LSDGERKDRLIDAPARRRIMSTTQRSTRQQAITSQASGQHDGAQAKRRTNHGLLKPVQPSAELAAIVGNAPLPRTEITKRLWAYIKEHGLQDAQNKRLINADTKLRPVVSGQEQVSMFDLPKLVSRHMQ